MWRDSHRRPTLARERGRAVNQESAASTVVAKASPLRSAREVELPSGCSAGGELRSAARGDVRGLLRVRAGAQFPLPSAPSPFRDRMGARWAPSLEATVPCATAAHRGRKNCALSAPLIRDPRGTGRAVRRSRCHLEIDCIVSTRHFRPGTTPRSSLCCRPRFGSPTHRGCLGVGPFRAITERSSSSKGWRPTELPTWRSNAFSMRATRWP